MSKTHDCLKRFWEYYSGMPYLFVMEENILLFLKRKSKSKIENLEIKPKDDPNYRSELQKQQSVSNTKIVRIVGLVLLLSSIVVGVFGFFSSNHNNLTFWKFVEDFYANVSTELASIAITVLIIDSFNERRQTTDLRGRLLREMGSEDNGFALRAVVELRAYGWLTNGSLKNAYLRRANLYRANLLEASLPKCYLRKANLELAYLGYADLREADLVEADLTRATFENSNLESADLTGAKLKSTKFIKTNLLNAKFAEEEIHLVESFEGSVMPNGDPYEVWREKRKNKGA